MRLPAAGLVLLLSLSGCGSDSSKSAAPSDADALTCKEAGKAVAAQAKRDWPATVTALGAAWQSGHVTASPPIRERLSPPGALSADDSQSVTEATDLLAIACGLPVNQ